MINDDDEEGRTYPGVYRGRVISNADPLGKGRVTAQCPDVHGLLPTTWAMPCVPMTGLQSGVYLVPPLHAGVWIMFEEGDINHPIWMGCWWDGREEVPALAQASVPPNHAIVLQTVKGYSISISDTMGIMLKSPGGASIILTDSGLTITAGKAAIKMQGVPVSINGKALVIN
jgi:hypothetical protein